jgi:hypothetical protein
MRGLRVALDDERNYTIDQIDVLFRTPETALSYLTEFTTQDIDMLYMDNDLGPGKTEGREVLRTLLREGVLPRSICLITANTVARSAMEKDLLDFGYTRFNEKVWKLEQTLVS